LEKTVGALHVVVDDDEIVYAGLAGVLDLGL
jgi:hypothetical protein